MKLGQSFLKSVLCDKAQWLNLGGFVSGSIIVFVIKPETTHLNAACYVYCLCVQCGGIGALGINLLRTRRARKQWMAKYAVAQQWLREYERVFGEFIVLPDWHPDRPTLIKQMEEIARRVKRESHELERTK